MKVEHLKGKDKPITQKQQMKNQLKGKATLSQAEKDALLLQMAKDLGYMEG